MSTGTLQTIDATIRAYIDTQWGATTAVHWPNQSFNPEGVDEWIAPYIRPADTTRDWLTGVNTLGQVQRGLLVIQIFVRPNTAPSVAEAHYDTLAALFNEVDITFNTTDLIRFGIPSASVQAQSERSPFFQITLTVEYTHDDSSA